MMAQSRGGGALAFRFLLGRPLFNHQYNLVYLMIVFAMGLNCQTKPTVRGSDLCALPCQDHEKCAVIWQLVTAGRMDGGPLNSLQKYALVRA
jgi:hypothetical protein